MSDLNTAEKKIASYQLSLKDIENQVEILCRKYHVQHLYLCGSYAKGTSVKTSDIDFAVKGCRDFDALNNDVQDIMTLKKIDLLDYDHIENPYLKEDIDMYHRKIY